MSGVINHYVLAVEASTGTIREEDGPFVSREDAEDRAEEFRTKWTLDTTVRVVARVEEEDRA